VFESYSGVPSPVSLAPERFLVVQANLLAALRSDLMGIVVWRFSKSRSCYSAISVTISYP